MLVVSRRSKEKISFPQVGITIHFIRVQSGSVKVGVDAPRDIAIVRDEIDQNAESTASLIRRQFLRLPKEIRHGIRNELHQISVGMHLYRELVRSGLEKEAEEIFESMQDALGRIDQNEVLQRPTSSSTESDNVLLVEDVDNEREMLADFLRLHGFRVSTFANGNEMLDYVSQHGPPKVLLVDMKMPQCDGPTAVRQFRSNDQSRTTRVFAISGTSPADNGLENGSEGVDRWFPKPVNPHGLIRAIDAACRQPAEPFLSS